MMKVIIADDESRVCQLICSLVNWKQFDMEIVGVAHDGFQVLDAIRAHSPDLVITDIRMPGMDGLQTISQAKGSHPNTDFIIISGYRDFEYAQNAIKYGVSDYLLKPVKKEELSGTLEKMRQRWRQRTEQLTTEEKLKFRLQSDIERLRGELFRDMLRQDGPAPGMEMEAVNEAYHFQFRPGLFQAFVVKMDFSSPEDCSELSTDILKDKVSKIMCGLLGAECFEMALCFQRSVVYGILNYEEAGAPRIRRQLSACIDELLVLRSIFEQVGFTIGLGGAVPDIRQAGASMHGAVAAAAQRLVDRIPNRRMFEEVPERALDSEKLLLTYKNSVGAALELLDAQAAGAAVDWLRDAALKQPGAGGHEVYSLVLEAHELFVTLLGLMQDGAALDTRQLSAAFQNNAELLSSAEELFLSLRNEVTHLLAVQLEERRQTETRPIRNAKQYIRERYMYPLTLEEVSGVVGFNASYFSTLFKKECGVTFLEYLSEARINKAKELLKDKDLGVAQICGMVGYIDLKHFNKTFEKYAGVKPAVFRKLYS